MYKKRIFSINGHKVSSLFLDEHALQFSNVKDQLIDDHKKAIDKGIAFMTKHLIKYEQINYIKKEDNDKDIVINHKIFIGAFIDLTFSFKDQMDNEIFFNFLVKERFFTKSYEKISPQKASKNYLIWLIVTLFFTFVTYKSAIKLENTTIAELQSRKFSSFDYLVRAIGHNGVLVIGILIALYFIFKVWKRYSNPPNQLIFLPPNAIVN